MPKQIAPPDLTRVSEWSIDESLLYELAWMELMLRKNKMNVLANKAKALREAFE